MFRKVLDLPLREEDLQSCTQTLSLHTTHRKRVVIFGTDISFLEIHNNHLQVKKVMTPLSCLCGKYEATASSWLA